MQWICCYFAEKTFMDCWKVIYENIEKKNSQQTYLYIPVTDHLKFYEVLICTYC